MSDITILKRSHHFVATNLSQQGKVAVEQFAKRFVQFGQQRIGYRYVRAALRVFAASTFARDEYRFHINCLSEFEKHIELSNFKGDQVVVIETPIPSYDKVNLTVFEHWTVRDYQEPVIEYICRDDGPRSRFVDLQTGKGKSFCAMRSIANLGLRSVYIVKAMYLEKWAIDIRKTYVLEPEDLLMIKGSNQLMGTLLMAAAGELEAKIILLSNKTMQNYIKLYEKHGNGILDMGYACTPDQFFEVLRAGMRVIDEVHQDFHLNFKIDLYTNVWRSLSLSATLLADDPFVNSMYNVAYPKADQYKGPAYDKYIHSTAFLFQVREPSRIRTKDPASKNYNHHLFEQTVMKQKEVFENYLDMINSLVISEFLNIKKDGEKLIIFCQSVEMCTDVVTFLQAKYPDLNIKRYAGSAGDPYEENLMQPDIRVSTLGSSGTAVDIPLLRTTILTIAVSSSQANIQGFGRLRKMPNGSEPRFIYFVGVDFDKHVEYHEKKRTMIGDRSVSFKTRYYPAPI